MREKADHSLALAQLVRQPVQTLVQAVTLRRARRLDVPLSAAQIVQAELVSKFGGRHGVRQVLLVGEHEQGRVAKFVLVQHLVELLARLVNTFAIVGVDDKDEALCVLKVVPPERSDLVLTSDVPHSERDVLVFHSLYVEADSRDGRDDFTELQFVQNRRFTGSVQTHHQDAHLFLAEKATEQAGNR